MNKKINPLINSPAQYCDGQREAAIGLGLSAESSERQKTKEKLAIN